MKRNCAALAVAVLGLMFTAQLRAGEKGIKKSQLPQAVQKTIDEQSQGATIKGYAKEVEKGQIQYEVELIVSGHSKDISMDSKGNIVEVEEEVDVNSLPTEVREGLQQRAKKGNIIKVESLTKRGTLVAYEAQVRTGKRKSEIQVGPEGKALAHPE